jgi:hypothetical protein
MDLSKANTALPRLMELLVPNPKWAQLATRTTTTAAA